ncbi:MAG: hypothetical protein KC646_14650 [Candidatus Cloacimonetes bacterium]|nr:hypothetical protein [Candidatus Cloacimonadota bacterium]
MKLIYIFTYIVLSSQLYSQISGEYLLGLLDEKMITFDLLIRHDKSKNIIVPPINLKGHSILKNAKFLKMESLASSKDSSEDSYVYRYEISLKEIDNRLPKLSVKYLEDQKEKYFEISPLALSVPKASEFNWLPVGGALLLIACVLPFFVKKRVAKSIDVKIDLQELWRTNQYELFLKSALENQDFAMDKALLQEYYDQVKYAGIELNSRQKAQIEKNFKDKKTQIKTVEKEREDQFLASVLED